jgi:hypothetical protein
MLSELPLTIPAWGFLAAELAALPVSVKLELVSAGPFAAPVLVHARAAESFMIAAQAHPRADGSLAPAVLYDPGDASLAPGGIAGFADVIDSAHLERLAELFVCPEYFVSVEYAEELPNRYLAQLRRPIADVPTADLPLPAPMIAHLGACIVCRTAFNDAVAARLRFQRMAFCPSPAELNAYLLGSELPNVARHLDTCQHCRSEAAALRQHRLPAWVTIQLAADNRTTSETTTRAPLPAGSGARRHVLSALLQGFLVQFQLGGLQALRRVAAEPRGHTSVAALIATLEQGESIRLVRERRDLVLQLTPDQNAVAISALRGEGQDLVEDFAVEVWSEDVLHWHGRSKQGRTVLPLAALQAAAGEGATRLVVRSKPDVTPPQ